MCKFTHARVRSGRVQPTRIASAAMQVKSISCGAVVACACAPQREHRSAERGRQLSGVCRFVWSAEETHAHADERTCNNNMCV